MKRLTASRCAFAILVGLPLLPVFALGLNGQPVVVFFFGAAVFFINVLLLTMLAAASSMPLAGSPPVAKRFRFTIRDILCLTVFWIGIVAFMVAGFQCEAAERASRPDSLPAVMLRRFVWEMESGLVLLTVGGLIWIRFRRPSPFRQETTPSV